jgi:hypothetical protein
VELLHANILYYLGSSQKHLLSAFFLWVNYSFATRAFHVLSFATTSDARTRSVDAAVSARSMLLTRPFQMEPGGGAFQNRTVVACGTQ